MASRVVTVGLVQMRRDKDPAVSLQRALAGIEEAADKGAQIVCLPELFISPYFCQRPDDKSAFDFTEQVPTGPTSQALAKAAKGNHVLLVGGSIFEKTDDGMFYNTSVLFDV